MQSLIGVLVKDFWRYQAAILAKDNSYLSICNRYEKLQVSPDSEGFFCDWLWTSDLHAPKILPFLGKQLFRKALIHHPIAFADSIENLNSPQVSFIIGHRGKSRLSHLLKTLESIAGQIDITLECIVVEQDNLSILPEYLPSWVEYIHTPLSTVDMLYCRSWAFNVGAKQAKSDVLIFHDNDFLISQDYAKEVLRRIKQGYEVVNVKRFLFYLSQLGTKQFFDGRDSLIKQPLEKVVQNLEAGGSIAIARDKYWEIGGFDEAFIGWGGEDNEFWERAQTLKVWNYGYLPMVHLWHPSQPGKDLVDTPAISYYQRISQIPIDVRISNLIQCLKSNPIQD
ncbi:glycosyltransferase family 2 protein [Pseudanabaena mucicola]|uniref:Glycosyltransferase n=1 Tax=Pseudanabaena mucicola FACHB-723 TaxID=2692860 RepID=A0ABR7ZT18_9CYAN|nr:galactosyltransferase-related protein [Pseudanabaena mucicola]MBD2187091.1 glycosyltransferase [Pseudanabaena mucicola FACHB-723]